VIAAARLNPNIWWYLARSSGLVAWGLMATTVLWGLVYAGRLTRKVPPPAWNLDLHRFLGALSVVFVAIHVLGLAADKYVDVGLSQILVPFASTWRPGAVAWGVTGMYVLLAVEVTSLVKQHLPRRVWRSVHLLSFVLFVVATVHAIQSGTDLASPVVRVVGVALIAATSVTAVLRIVRARTRAQARASGPTPAGPPVGQRPLEATVRG
jgi:DMSO/TMAO reductase YedYZ heme-binding membrane subunit